MKRVDISTQEPHAHGVASAFGNVGGFLTYTLSLTHTHALQVNTCTCNTHAPGAVLILMHIHHPEESLQEASFLSQWPPAHTKAPHLRQMVLTHVLKKTVGAQRAACFYFWCIVQA